MSSFRIDVADPSAAVYDERDPGESPTSLRIKCHPRRKRGARATESIQILQSHTCTQDSLLVTRLLQ